MKRWIKTIIIIAVVICALLVWIISPGRPVFQDDEEGPDCIYKDHGYYKLKHDGAESYWDFRMPLINHLLLIDQQIIGWRSFVPFKPGAGLMITATRGKVPEFILFDSDDVYFREDVDLGSEFDTAFKEIKIYYGRDVEKDKKNWIDYPEGTTFTDIVGETPITYTRSGNNIQHGDGESADVAEVTFMDIHKNHTHYATLRCAHPEYKYIYCDFPIGFYNGNYYLYVSRWHEDNVAYYLLDDPFDNGGETAGADDAGEK